MTGKLAKDVKDKLDPRLISILEAHLEISWVVSVLKPHITIVEGKSLYLIFERFDKLIDIASDGYLGL